MDFFALYNGRYRPRKRPVAGGGVLLACFPSLQWYWKVFWMNLFMYWIFNYIMRYI